MLGSLLYVPKSIKYARFFLNHMLALLRENFDKKYINVTEEFKQDLNWFNTFLAVYYGVSFFTILQVKLYTWMLVHMVWVLFLTPRSKHSPYHRSIVI